MTIIIQKYFDEFKRLYVKHEANIVTDEEKRPHWEHTQKKRRGGPINFNYVGRDWFASATNRFNQTKPLPKHLLAACVTARNWNRNRQHQYKISAIEFI